MSSSVTLIEKLQLCESRIKKSFHEPFTNALNFVILAILYITIFLCYTKHRLIPASCSMYLQLDIHIFLKLTWHHKSGNKESVNLPESTIDYEPYVDKESNSIALF